MARLIIVEDNAELATLIAATARSRGHVARAVHSGQSALAALTTGSFDVAVVDLLLPDMKGGDVLAQLRDRGVPAIAVSGVYKGEPFADEAINQHGARAFFEKPFAMDDLFGEVEKIAGIPPPVDAASEDDDEDTVVALIDEGQDAEPIQQPPSEAASDWEKVWKKPAVAPPKPKRPAAELANAGDLRSSSVPRLLNAYYQARHDGELKVKQGAVVKVVYFEAGSPVYAASNLAHERFARFCGKKGLLPESELTAVAQLAKEENLRTGDAMVKLGLIDEAQRRALLEDQVKEIIWSTFSWKEGQYAFSPKRPTRTDLVKLSVFPGNLIFDGVFKTETLVSLRGRMPSERRLFPTADPPYALSDFKLSGPQAMLIAYADGSKTVEDLLTLADLSERDALATLLAFEMLGMLEERRDDGGGKRRISFGL